MSSKHPPVSKQTTHHGIVVFAKFDAEFRKGFGFIEPAGSNGSTANNVFFGGFATQGAPTERGDEVSYVLKVDQDGRGRGPVAHRVWIRKRAVENDDREQIETIAGEYDT